MHENNNSAKFKQIFNNFEALISLKLAFPMQMFKLTSEDNSNDVVLQCFDYLAYFNMVNYKNRPGEVMISTSYKTHQIDCSK